MYAKRLPSADFLYEKRMVPSQFLSYAKRAVPSSMYLYKRGIFEDEKRAVPSGLIYEIQKFAYRIG